MWTKYHTRHYVTLYTSNLSFVSAVSTDKLWYIDRVDHTNLAVNVTWLQRFADMTAENRCLRFLGISNRLQHVKHVWFTVSNRQSKLSQQPYLIPASMQHQLNCFSSKFAILWLIMDISPMKHFTYCTLRLWSP